MDKKIINEKTITESGISLELSPYKSKNTTVTEAFNNISRRA